MIQLRYKAFAWPQLPRHYAESWVRERKFDKEGNFLGMTAPRRVIQGEGAFYGPGAYEAYLELARVFQEGGSGEWEHSLWGKCQGYLMELNMTQEPREEYVGYQFRFEEE